jgi:hypothetical protein
MKVYQGQSKTEKFRCSGWTLVLAAMVAVVASSTFAQNRDTVGAGLAIWKNAGCSDCHGYFANGEPDDDDYPIGANLRTATLDADTLKSTIRCGRAGAGMPAFDADAYTRRACYGRPLGPAPDNMQPSVRKLTASEIDDVVAYLHARIIGRGPITREECLTYFEGREDMCEDYK